MFHGSKCILLGYFLAEESITLEYNDKYNIKEESCDNNGAFPILDLMSCKHFVPSFLRIIKETHNRNQDRKVDLGGEHNSSAYPTGCYYDEQTRTVHFNYDDRGSPSIEYRQVCTAPQVQGI